MISLKKSYVRIFTLIATIFIASEFAYASSETVFVAVKNAKLKSKADFLSSTVGELTYGEALNILSTEGSWANVKSRSGKQGYIHTSAFNTSPVALNSGAKFKGGANDETITLAGKGFNEDVEKNYAKQNTNLNYAAVDRMEQNKVSDGEVRAFIKEGGLKGE